MVIPRAISAADLDRSSALSQIKRFVPFAVLPRAVDAAGFVYARLPL